MRMPVTIFGYGNQGRAQALNLRDAGVTVTIALRQESPRIAEATADGLPVTTDITAAAQNAACAILLIPDTAHPTLWTEYLQPHLPSGATLCFAHGYNIHYRTMRPRADLDVVLVAPLASGTTLRRNFLAGEPTPIALAVHQDASGTAGACARAYAEALTKDPRHLFPTTFQEETETDLFSEQILSCGGLAGLIRAAFDTLVAAGYSETMAYYTCLHEVKDLASVFAHEGLAGAFGKLSPTARYGALTRGPRVIGAPAREAMATILAEIRDGRFADELAAEAAGGFATTAALLQTLRTHLLEKMHAQVARPGGAT